MEEMLRSGAVAMDLKQQLSKVCFVLLQNLDIGIHFKLGFMVTVEANAPTLYFHISTNC